MKMFVSDLDGTLLNRQHQLDALEKTMIETLLHKNYRFVLASGRSFQSIKEVVNIQGVDYICLNGALAYTKELRLIYDEPINASCLKEVLRILNKYRIAYLLYGKEKTYCSSKYAYFFKMFRWLKRYSLTINWLKTFQPMKEYDQQAIYKIEFETLNPKVYKAISNIKELHVVNTNPITYEVTSKQASKKEALLALLKDSGILQEEVMCFGDNYNDESMLRHFPHSYLMANAHAPLKKRILQHTLSNQQHGVYHILRRYL